MAAGHGSDGSSKGSSDDIWTQINDHLEKQDPKFLVGILVAIFVVILTIALFFRRRSVSRRSVLLLGLCESGKTTLFSRLLYDKVFPTQTSIKENTGIYGVPSEKKQSLNIVDVPGHERLRYKFFEQFKSSARAIIFVIDSLTYQKDMKNVAEFMYNILTDVTLAQNSLPFLIACNKDDYPLAKGPTVIRSALEKELNHVRTTRSASLSTTDGHGNALSFLGKPNRDFTFSDAKPVRVEFAKCSAKGGTGKSESDVQEIVDWLIRVA